jgi:hypothetical protein
MAPKSEVAVSSDRFHLGRSSLIECEAVNRSGKSAIRQAV